MHLGTETLSYVNRTFSPGMQYLWAGAVVPGRYLSLMSRFSGASCPHCKCRSLVPFTHRVAVQTARRTRTEIGAKAVLPDPSIVGARRPLGWFRAPARNPQWRSTGHAKMRHRCVARVKQLRDQTRHEEVGGFEGWYLRRVLKQESRHPEVRASS